MTVQIKLTTKTGRTITQNFAGCTDVEDGKRKCREIFEGCKIKEAVELQEKKK